MTSLPLPEAGYDRILNGPRSVQPSPGEEQQGRAAQAMKSAEAALAQQLSSTAEFDRQIIEALRHAHKTTDEGRRRLDNLEAEIVGAAQGWDLGTAAGAREFQRFLIAKLSEIVRVVEEANDDDTSKRALAAALTALYATPAERDTAAPAEKQPEPPDDPASPAFAATDGEEAYLDPLPDDEPEAGYSLSPQRPPEAPALPMVPGLGGEGPGFGAMPAAMPAGFPSAGLLPGPEGGDAAAGDESEPAETTPADAAFDDDKADADAPPETGDDKSLVTVTLPDGATTTVTDPRLAAAMQAAADGTPVAEAFRRQGIDIPPPGIPVAAPVDQASLRPGDIGVFTDRHAVAVGDGKALLDGQVHLAGNLRGPGFLGWQHLRIAEYTPTGEPAPTRPAGLLRGPMSLKIRVSPVIVD
ncbi:DUF4226 domain-containing protein [Mycobacterium sp. CSUR Q5927]|nr:DUF4226 domain-containing protein [Mycobacterium sp. CSUR Q5927]